MTITVAAWFMLAQAFNSAPHPEGVDMDPKGVLRTGKTELDPRLAELRKKGLGKEKDRELCYISVPRILAEAKKCIEANQPLPDNVRFLGGMVKLQYIFVYPEEGDLVIAGPAEPFDATVGYRPLGTLTGRPVLQLDDLVVALRAFGNGKSPFRIGCDIHITKEIAERVDKKVKEVSSKLGESMKAKDAAEAIAEAGGEQPVEYYGIATNTRFAFVCVEADYRLKQLGLSLIKSPVPAVRSYFSLIPRPERNHRFSLETHYDAIVVSPEGNAFELRGPSLKVNTGLLRLPGDPNKPMNNPDEASEYAKKFMNAANENFAELCRSLISWADLQNLGDLTLLSAILARAELDKKIKWDMSWALSGYPVAEVKTPTGAKVLCNTRHASGMILFTSGGVGLWGKTWADKRTPDDKGELKDKMRRPGADGAILIPTKQK
jgi:hypothetical protein